MCVRNKAALGSPGTDDLPSPHTITTSLLTQCKKKQTAYQVVAMETTGEVASALQVDIFSEFADIALPILTPVGLLHGCMTAWWNGHMTECVKRCMVE